MFYMVTGYMFRRNMETEFDKCNTQRTRIAVLIVYLLLVFIPFFGKIELPMIADILYRYLLSVVGVVELAAIAKVASTNKYINYVGQNTLIYFALPEKCIALSRRCLKGLWLLFIQLF